MLGDGVGLVLGEEVKSWPNGAGREPWATGCDLGGVRTVDDGAGIGVQE